MTGVFFVEMDNMYYTTWEDSSKSEKLGKAKNGKNTVTGELFNGRKDVWEM